MITAPLTEEAARVSAAWQIARCEPMSGVLRAVLTKAQAAALYDDLTGFPVQICGVPTNTGVTILIWLPTRDIDLMIIVLRRMFRYTYSVQKLFAKDCPEYPGSIWLTGRALLTWLLKGTNHNAAPRSNPAPSSDLSLPAASTASIDRAVCMRDARGSRE